MTTRTAARRWFPGTTWTPGGPAEPRPLFGLDVLAGADPSRAVLVPEGEKCAAALRSLGLVAVASQGGAKAAGKTDWSPLAGRSRVYLLSDLDAPGEDYARDVARSLAALEKPPEVLIVRLPGLAEAGDVVDWLLARCPGWDGFEPIPETERDRLRAELLETVKAVAEPPPVEWLATAEEWPAPEPLTASVAPAGGHPGRRARSAGVRPGAHGTGRYDDTGGAAEDFDDAIPF